MITIRKLSTLPKKTALRKAAVLLQGFEVELAAGRSVDTGYLTDMVRLVIAPAEERFSGPVEKALSALAELPRVSRPEGGEAGWLAAARVSLLRRICNDLRYALYDYLEVTTADWDLLPPAGFGTRGKGEDRVILPFTVFLEDLRSPFNVGSIFRCAESFCVERIVLTSSCPAPDSPRASRSAMGCDRTVPWAVGDLDAVKGEPVFALETGGTLLEDFEFPRRGVVILGNEELGVSPQARKLASMSAGVVTIPLYGSKGSLNVAAAFAILVHFWSMRVLSSGQKKAARN